MTIGWNFPSNDNGQINGISEAGIETFKGSPFPSLAREICQNSLDAKKENNNPVIVEFSDFEVEHKEINGYSDIESALDECKIFWKNNAKASKFLQNACKVVQKDKIKVLRVSDYNTKGLTGSKEPYNSPWQNLVKSSGVSDKGGTSGGSFGIGKSAPFACSDIRTVMYSTFDIDSIRAYQGVSRLVSFNHKKQNLSYITQGIGYYGNTDKNAPVFEEYSLGKFKRTETGTDIYILGFKQTDSWQDEIIKAVLEGFVISVMRNELIVRINDFEINSSTICDCVEKYKEESPLAYNYYQVLISPDTIEKTENFNNMGNITLRVLLKDDMKRKVLMSRSNGMKIFDKQNISSSISFAAVLTLDDDKINKCFREMETPQHNAWEPERLETESDVRKAKKILRDLYRWIKNQIIEMGAKSIIDEIDAVGIGEFIPDSDLGNQGDNEKNESLDSKNSIIDVQQVKNVKIQKGFQHTESIGISGEIEAPGFYDEDDGDDTTYIPGGDPNESEGGRGTPSAGKENPEGKDVVYKTVQIKPIYIRLFMSDYQNRRYRLIISPEDNAENCYVNLTVSGEQSNIKIPVKSAVMNNQSLQIKSNKIFIGKVSKSQKIMMDFSISVDDICSMDVDHSKRNILLLINRALNPAHKLVINLDFLCLFAVRNLCLVNNYLFDKRVQNRRVKLGDKAEILDKLNKAVHIFHSRLAVANCFFKLGDLTFKCYLLGFVLCGKLFVVSLRNVTADLVLVQTGKQTVKLR